MATPRSTSSTASSRTRLGQARAPPAARARSRRHQAAVSRRRPRAGIAFASEIKALFHSGFVTPAHQREAARASSSCSGRSRATKICSPASKCCRPATRWSCVRGARKRRAVTGRSARNLRRSRATSDEATDALDALLNRAVQRQLMSDVPLGTFCSGGIDSSLTTAIAARHMSRAINTFSVGFHEADFDESVYARMASQGLRARRTTSSRSTKRNSRPCCRSSSSITTCRSTSRTPCTSTRSASSRDNT